MKPHDAVPEFIPMRDRPVGMRAETIAALNKWGLEQERPAKAWMMRRAAAYWDLGEHRQRAGHAQLEATAALDLLVWRTEAGTDREAVDNLATWDGLAPKAQYVNLHTNCFHLHEVPVVHERRIVTP